MDNSSHFFKSRINRDYCQTVMIRVYLTYFYIMKICSSITKRFCFGSQFFFIVDRFAIKFFLISVLAFFQIVLYLFNKSSSSIKKYIQWLNFVTIIQVTNKVFIVFFSPEEILLGTHTLSVSTSYKKYNFYRVKSFVFQF